MLAVIRILVEKSSSISPKKQHRSKIGHVLYALVLIGPLPSPSARDW
jgi:hypothetical protein